MVTFLTEGVDDRRINEAYVKGRVRRFLTSIKAWQFWPVQTGLGAQGIPDCVFCWNGIFGSIETKRPGRRNHKDRGCTKLQIEQGRQIRMDGSGLWFVVDGPYDLNEVRTVLNLRMQEGAIQCSPIEEKEIVKLCTGYWKSYCRSA